MTKLASSVYAKKSFSKIQHLLMIKALMKLGIEEMYLNIRKATYEKPITNTILNGGELKSFTLKQERDKVSTHSTLIQHSLEIPS
jgi:hypothetical protein